MSTDFQRQRELWREASRRRYWRDPEKQRRRTRKHRADNLEKVRAQDRLYRLRHLESAREATRRTNWARHGIAIDADQYDALFVRQGGRCAICDNKSRKRLSVDHSHETGAIRGLLCDACNRALGGFKDDLNLLLKAVNYLNRLPA